MFTCIHTWYIHVRTCTRTCTHTHTHARTLNRASNQSKEEHVYLAREIWILHARSLHLQGKMEAARDVLSHARECGMISAETLADDTLNVHIPEVCVLCMYLGYCDDASVCD
jgi:hypothetical protein